MFYGLNIVNKTLLFKITRPKPFGQSQPSPL